MVEILKLDSILCRIVNSTKWEQQVLLNCLVGPLSQPFIREEIEVSLGLVFWIQSLDFDFGKWNFLCPTSSDCPLSFSHPTPINFSTAPKHTCPSLVPCFWVFDPYWFSQNSASGQSLFLDLLYLGLSRINSQYQWVSEMSLRQVSFTFTTCPSYILSTTGKHKRNVYPTLDGLISGHRGSLGWVSDFSSSLSDHGTSKSYPGNMKLYPTFYLTRETLLARRLNACANWFASCISH